MAKPPLSDPMAEALAEDAANAAAKAQKEAALAEVAEASAEKQPPAESPLAEEGEGEKQVAAPDGEQTETPEAKLKRSNEEALLRRLGKQTAERRAAEEREREALRRAQAAEELLSAGKTDGSASGAGAAVPTPPQGFYTAEQAQALARQIAETQSFNDRANQTYQAGKEKFGDFEPRMQALRDTGLMSAALLEAAMSANNPAGLLHHLGGDLSEAERISSLSPVRMGVELAMLAQKLEAPKGVRVSKAPDPISPINGVASPVVDFAKLAEGNDMKAFVEARKKAGDRWATGRRG